MVEKIQSPWAKRDILANWDIPEVEKFERTKTWYLITGIIFILLLIYCVLTTNFLFAVIIIFLAIIQYLNEKVGHTFLTFTITPDGMMVGEKFYPYKKIENFYIIYEPPEIKKLFIIFKSVLQPRLSIPFLDQNPVKIREILTAYLPEDLEKEYEPITDKLGRLLKF